MVDPEELEPPTTWFEARYSKAHLSPQMQG